MKKKNPSIQYKDALREASKRKGEMKKGGTTDTSESGPLSEDVDAENETPENETPENETSENETSENETPETLGEDAPNNSAGGTKKKRKGRKGCRKSRKGGKSKGKKGSKRR